MLPICTFLDDARAVKDSVLRKPVEVGRFSVDGNRKFHHDRHQMTCIVESYKGRLRKKFDLSDGYRDRFVKKDEDVKLRLNHMLEWMMANKDRFVSHDAKKRKLSENVSMIGEMPDFVLWRGHLTKFMCTPYENRDGWIMACQKLDRTIYVSEVESEEAAFKRRNRTDRESLMTYWGVRFEGYMTGPFPDPQHRSDAAVVDQTTLVTNTNRAFCSVIRSRLNQHHSLVYGAEVDGCRPVDVVTAPDCYIELKTNRIFSTRRQEDNFYRFKAVRWWAQSHLAGVPKIVCGFRNDHGFVQNVETFVTENLPLRSPWDPNRCLSFLDSVLSSIKALFAKENLDVDSVLLLFWNPGDRGVTYKISKNPADKFLPQWYLEDSLK